MCSSRRLRQPSASVLHGALALALAALACGGTVAAQDAPKTSERGAETAATSRQLARAQAEYEEAVKLSNAGRWREAIVKLRDVIVVTDTPEVRFQLARALVATGDYDAADELVDWVVQDPRSPDRLTEASDALRAQMDATGGKVVVSLSGAPRGAYILLDGHELAPDRLREPVRVRAGAHAVVVMRGGAELARKEASVAVGQTVPIELTIAPLSADVARASRAGAGEEEEPAERPPLRKDWRLWAGVGASVAAIALTVVLVKTVGPSQEKPAGGNIPPGTLVW